jgi:hypothetical protein
MKKEEYSEDRDHSRHRAQDLREKETVWLWGLGLGITILSSVVGGIWYFAHMDSRLTQLEFNVQSLIINLEKIDDESLRKTHDDVLILQKDNQHQNYRIKVTEDWMNAWIKRAEDKGQETKK